MIRKLIATFALLFLIGSCSNSSPQATFLLYHRDTHSSHGALLSSLEISLPTSTSLDQDLTSNHIHTLIMALFSLEPVYNKEPLFPSNTALLSFELQENGTLLLRFSQEYGELSGIYRTTADYALTLTLTQLTSVTGIRISVFGEDNADYAPLLRSYDITVADLVTR